MIKLIFKYLKTKLIALVMKNLTIFIFIAYKLKQCYFSHVRINKLNI